MLFVLAPPAAAQSPAAARSTGAAQPPAAASSARPNIIFFLVDDMGWEDSSVPFWTSAVPANHKFHTPNMERLAALGMKFTDAHAASVCTPSRVSLLSGMNAAHHRVTNWTMFKDQAVDAPDSILSVPDWNVNGLSPVKGVDRTVYVTTLPSLLRKAGYFTIHCGKAHFVAYQTPGANPLNLGFDINIAGSAAGNPASYLAEDDYGNVPGKFNVRAVPGLNEYWGTRTFLTEALTQRAMRAMDTAQLRHQPFFLYMAHYAVHVPYDADKRFIDKYLQMGLTKPEAAYAALIEGMDKSLGDLMNYLDTHGLTRNTIILFMSDNGGLSHAPRSGKTDTQNFPLRAGKGSLYEGGTREPMIVDWPGVTQPGSVNGRYVMIEDYFPTILDMAGVRHYHTVQSIDGKSFVPLLKGERPADTTRALIWNFPDKWIDQEDNAIAWVSAIRQGDWKLVYFQKTGKLELYNIRQDIGEQKDLAAAYPWKVKQLATLLTKQMKSWHAQLPVVKKTGKPVPWPDQL
jgi:arylsulfatase A-like enzyme